jgi:hypothetical protein
VQSFTDGVSNTILIVETADAVLWTKPEDLTFASDQPLPRLGGHYAGGFSDAFADGSIHFLPEQIDEKTLRGLITRNGDETIAIPAP